MWRIEKTVGIRCSYIDDYQQLVQAKRLGLKHNFKFYGLSKHKFEGIVERCRREEKSLYKMQAPKLAGLPAKDMLDVVVEVDCMS